VSTDLRTEDSGKLGLRLICPEGERFESWKDFAVTGKTMLMVRTVYVNNNVNVVLLFHSNCIYKRFLIFYRPTFDQYSVSQLVKFT